ncbi:hypothetical protein U0070_024793 [Myodes glareolus]|uniref:Interleukin-3 receptor subunit alpha n=1 Tax=Myodes glareolus TaxID=447135 RepID=A0AAW0GWQ8_MYOGA
MAAPWRLLLLLLLLLTLAPQACALTSEPAPRFRNLRLEPNELRLSWDGDVTSGSRQVHCQKGSNSPVRAPRRRPYCTFASLSLCHVTNFSVFLEEDPGSAAWIQFPESDTDRASAATDLHCWVHDVDVMTCRWGRGPGADEHAQYRMWWRDAALGRDRDRECAHYDVTDAQGAHLGCRVDLATLLPTHHVTVTVTGGGASCSDISVDLQRVEVLTPPVLAAVCNGSEEARLRWEMRSHFYHSFQYELQINKTSESHFRALIPGSASFRVRAKPMAEAQFSDWSHAVRLDCAPAAAERKHVTVMAAALAALGAGLLVLGTLLLCRR